ncbi:MAG: hypothetical protein IPG32_07565 [Saprospirales bacterium]|nr:hypothetical protein [Saprospirales bacterium]
MPWNYPGHLFGASKDISKYKKAKRAFLKAIRPEFIARNFPLSNDVGIFPNGQIKQRYLSRLKRLRVGPMKGGKAENIFSNKILDSGLI